MTHIDPFTIFAESRGVYLAARCLLFCRIVLKTNDSVKAATDAGYPAPSATADALYDEHRELLEAWRASINADYRLVLDVHRRAAAAKVARPVEGIGGTTELLIDDYKTQNMGAKGLTEVLGLDAPQQIKSDVTHTMRWLNEGEEP